MTRRPGFTLLELIVVIAILALLAGITIPAIQKARASAGRAGCASNLRQLVLATHNYIAVHGKYPEGVGYPFLRSKSDLDTHIGISWLTALLPYVEKDALWSEVTRVHRVDPTGETNIHNSVCVVPVPAFRCPSDGRVSGETNNGQAWALINFLGVAGTDHHFFDGILHRNWTTRVPDVTDGTSNTLYAGERPTGPQGLYCAWYARWGVMFPLENQLFPMNKIGWYVQQAVNCTIHNEVFHDGQYDNACDLNHYWSLHPGGANFAFGDGSVRFLRYTSTDILPLLATRAGGESVSLED